MDSLVHLIVKTGYWLGLLRSSPCGLIHHWFELPYMVVSGKYCKGTEAETARSLKDYALEFTSGTFYQSSKSWRDREMTPFLLLNGRSTLKGLKQECKGCVVGHD